MEYVGKLCQYVVEIQDQLKEEGLSHYGETIWSLPIYAQMSLIKKNSSNPNIIEAAHEISILSAQRCLDNGLLISLAEVVQQELQFDPAYESVFDLVAQYNRAVEQEKPEQGTVKQRLERAIEKQNSALVEVAKPYGLPVSWNEEQPKVEKEYKIKTPLSPIEDVELRRLLSGELSENPYAVYQLMQQFCRELRQTDEDRFKHMTRVGEVGHIVGNSTNCMELIYLPRKVSER